MQQRTILILYKQIPMNNEQKEKYSIEVHNQIIGWTSNCDTKASIILAFIGILVSITFTSEYLLGGVQTEIENIINYWKNGIGGFSLLSTLMFLSLFGFVIFTLLCCYFAISSLKANIECPDDSIIFFGKIAELSKEKYIERVNSVTEEEFEQDKLSQIHICAEICKGKFKFYNKSIKCLKWGLLLFICFVFFVILLK